MRNTKVLLLSIFFFLLAGETIYARSWKLEQIITVKQMCIQASLMETLGAISDKNMAKQFRKIYALIGGKKIMHHTLTFIALAKRELYQTFIHMKPICWIHTKLKNRF